MALFTKPKMLSNRDLGSVQNKESHNLQSSRQRSRYNVIERQLDTASHYWSAYRPPIIPHSIVLSPIPYVNNLDNSTLDVESNPRASITRQPTFPNNHQATPSMDNHTPAYVSQASDSQAFACTICIINQEEKPVFVDNHKICSECVTDHSIPRFHEALKFEINYPVEWSTGVVLDPRSFSEFFDDYKGFELDWARKEREYKTPGADRLYCKNVNQNCDAFIADRTTIISKIAFCHGCKEWVCKDCGKLDAKKHECDGHVQEDAPDELKDHKRCPGCRGLIELQDGCNHVRCQLGSCGTEFCYICLAVRPSRDHFSRGKPCPKFGKPTDEDALFAEDVFEQEELEEGEIIEDVDRQRMALIQWAITIHRMEVLLEAPKQPEELPTPMAEAVPTFATFPMAPRRLLDAHREVVQMLTDPAQVRQQQREIVAESHQLMLRIVHDWEEIEEDLQRQGLLTQDPTLARDLRNAAINLSMNLVIYLDPRVVRDGLEEFTRRHELIMDFFSRHISGELFFFSPAIYSAFHVYFDLAPAKLEAVRSEASTRHVDARRIMSLGRALRGAAERAAMDERMSGVEELGDSEFQAGSEFSNDETGTDDEEAARSRKVYSMRLHFRMVTLDALPPSRPGRDDNGYIAIAQRDIMEDDRANAQSLVDTIRDFGAIEIFHDLPSLANLDAEERVALRARFIEAAEKLAVNVDLYVHFDRIRASHAEYAQRHEDIMAFWNDDMPRAKGFFALEPEVSSAFLLYSKVAADRLAAAAPQRGD